MSQICWRNFYWFLLQYQKWNWEDLNPSDHRILPSTNHPKITLNWHIRINKKIFAFSTQMKHPKNFNIKKEGRRYFVSKNTIYGFIFSIHNQASGKDCKMKTFFADVYVSMNNIFHSFRSFLFDRKMCLDSEKRRKENS